jgi:cobalt/nickel transport system permease protein
VFIVAVSLIPIGGFLALGLAWMLVLLAAASARVGTFRPARRALLAAPFLLAAVPLIFTRAGEPLGSFDVGPLTVTVSGEGLRMFATIALKSWISVQAALLLAFTTPFHELVDGLRQLRLPQVMVSIVSFMYRYVGVLADEAARMTRARASRSADPTGRGGGSLRWRARVTGAMVGSLFLRSYERGERIYAAMQARGFEGEVRHLHRRGMTAGDVVLVALVAVTCVALVAAANLWLPR